MVEAVCSSGSDEHYVSKSSITITGSVASFFIIFPISSGGIMAVWTGNRQRTVCETVERLAAISYEKAVASQGLLCCPT